MSSTRTMRKSVLSIAMGLCLSSLAMAPVYAQSATGSVAGRATAGDQVTIVNSATGASRTVTVGADGSYRLSQLPVGEYSLQVTRAGQGVGHKGRPVHKRSRCMIGDHIGHPFACQHGR